MNYYRKPINKVIDDVKLKMQLSALTLKISENNDKIDDLIGVDKNIKKDVSSNLSKIDNNESDIASNSGKISTNEGNIASNLVKLNNMDIDVKKDIYKKTFIINNFETTSNFKPVFKTNIYFNLLKKQLLKLMQIISIHMLIIINTVIYTIFFNNNIKFNEIQIDHNSNIVKDDFSIPSIESSKIGIILYLNKNDNDSNVTLYDSNTIEIIYNDFAKIPKTDYNIDNIASNLEKITTNESSISSNSGRISTNESSISSNSGQISTNEGNISSNTGRISTNEGNISSNLGKIYDNKEDIVALQNSNIKSFYNLDRIFIFDIEKGYQTVNKDNYFHIFEKEIIYNFIKDSYLEFTLKVLTEVSNYVLIGYFQILCNFYDENDNLFYTISLSTAMGSINKLSTIKSVFIVPINKNMTKIKIDFFIMPKLTQQNRSAKFIIHDI